MSKRVTNEIKEFIDLNRIRIIDILSDTLTDYDRVDNVYTVLELSSKLKQLLQKRFNLITVEDCRDIVNDIIKEVFVLYDRKKRYEEKKKVKEIRRKKEEKETLEEVKKHIKLFVENKANNVAKHYGYDYLIKLINNEIGRKFALWNNILTTDDYDEFYTIYELVYNEVHKNDEKSKSKSKVIKVSLEDNVAKDVIEQINKTGFKSPQKVLKIVGEMYPEIDKNDLNINYIKQHLKMPVNSFPLKENKKRYSLRVVAPVGTYIMDLMFVSGFVYLIAINVNTRKAYAKETSIYESDEEAKEILVDKAGGKTIKQIKEALIYLMSYTDFRPNIIRGDGEKAFNAKSMLIWFRQQHINFIPVRRLMLNDTAPHEGSVKDKFKSDPSHGSLSIIDRFIRTLRDMAFNAKIKNITPDVMKMLIKNYNIAPHKHLSKYIGENTSPNDMDEEKEKYLIRRLCQENYNIRNGYGYMLPKGTKVDVYNEKDVMFKRRSLIKYGDFEVVDYKGGLYKVDNGIKNEWIPRYMLYPKEKELRSRRIAS